MRLRRSLLHAFLFTTALGLSPVLADPDGAAAADSATAALTPVVKRQLIENAARWEVPQPTAKAKLVKIWVFCEMGPPDVDYYEPPHARIQQFPKLSHERRAGY